ncbi:MAG: cytochrome c family protein [Alphaproteobacteria bacterium]|nr:cytochrome c family protein [Alphaproteobacteria bacterium]
MATTHKSDPLLWNKVAGAVLFGGLIAMACGFVAELLVHPHKLKENVFVVAVPEGGAAAAAGGAAPKEVEPVAPLLAKANAAEGEKAAKKCLACHTFDKGAANKIGPNLWNVVGGPRAHSESFSYSNTLAGMHGQTWDYEDLNKFLNSPKGFVAGTKMAFAGIPSAKERADVIAYLRSLSDAPKPLP